MEVRTQSTQQSRLEDNIFNDPQPISEIDQLAVQTMSDQPSSPRGSNSKSDNSNKDCQSRNSTEPDNLLGYISLKSIKSKEEIQIESKENQEILLSLNSNIDDLFRKISSLTQQITTQLQPRQAKHRKSPIRTDKIIKHAQSDIPAQIQYKQNTESSLFVQFKPLLNLQHKKQYASIFFQHHRSTAKDYSINMKLFQTGKSLGCGKFGEVVQCRNIHTNALYALKKIFKSVIEEYNMEDQLLTQLKILTQINHPNIVKAYEAFTDDFHIFILMEYIHGPLLVKKLKCTQKECKVIIKQVLLALKYLHENNIAHRDIKPQNIIITADDVVKICDFGWASQGTQKMNILCGTLDYVSPQMAGQKEYTAKIDLWNLGVLTYELMYGYPPFKASSKSRIFEKVRNMQFEFSDQIQISQECKDFIRGFLTVQSKRESIEWGLSHSFIKVNKKQEQNPLSLIKVQINRQINQLLQ